MAAELALEWVDGEHPQKSFRQTGARDTPNEIASAIWTFDVSH